MSTGPVLVLGSGAWGTALAMVLAERGVDVRVWGFETDYVPEIERTRKNPRFLPGVEIPAAIRFDSDVTAVAGGVDTVVSTVPTQHLRRTLTTLGPGLPKGARWVSCSKGFEIGTLERPSEIIAGMNAGTHPVVLSGPSHAEEVSRQLPAAVVAASADPASSVAAQELFAGPRFRVYTSSDPVGVEIGGATKNVIAIACGIADGLGFGVNTRSALMTRGLHEMRRLGTRLGGDPATFAGLSGMGDLIATCSSQLSRNHTVGERIGHGERLDDILASTPQVAEGVPTTESLHQLSSSHGVELPITGEVYSVLFEGKDPRDAVEALMGRESKAEPE